METLVLIIVLLAFFISGTPIALSFIGTSIVCYLFFTEVPLIAIANGLFNKLDSFPLEAILFFILLGNIMKDGKTARHLVELTKVMMRKIPGGLGIAGITACAFFGAISGSATATLVAIGTTVVPAMIARGYDKSFALGLLTSSSILGIIIPPSIVMIVYAMVVNVSVAALFLGGFLPGILIAFGLSLYTYFKRRKQRELGNDEPTDLLQSIGKAIWALMLPIIVLGGIYGGIFTPTEAAVVGCVYAYFVELFIHRTLDFNGSVQVLQSAGIQTAALLITLAGASIFGDYLTLMQIPQSISNWVLENISTQIEFLIWVNLLFLLLGMFIDPLSAIILVTPLLMPAMRSFNIDPVFMGVILTVNLGIGYITPPLGANLFIASMVMKESFIKVTYSVIPMLIIYLIALVILNIFPAIIMALPKLLL